jgi:hypothetical protein
MQPLKNSKAAIYFVDFSYLIYFFIMIFFILNNLYNWYAFSISLS